MAENKTPENIQDKEIENLLEQFERAENFGDIDFLFSNIATLSPSPK